MKFYSGVQPRSGKCPLFLKKHNLAAAKPWFVGILLTGLTACTTAPSTQVELTLKAAPAGRTGTYQVTGTTNLPAGSRLAIAAIRSLHPDSARSQSTSTHGNYAILARQVTEVAAGKWQTPLHLWQVAPDGHYQESWQPNLNQVGKLQQPSEQVTFLAILEPEDQSAAVRQQLEQKNFSFGNPLSRVTAEGDRYFQASQKLPVPLPFGKTTPPTTTASDTNGGWGDRDSRTANQSQVDRSKTEKPIQPANQENQTDAPLAAPAVMR